VAVHRSVYLDMELGEEAVAKEIAKYMAHLYFSRGNKPSTVEGKLVAVQHFHRRVGIELPMKHFIVKSVKAGIARESALKGEPQRIRRPISWVMLKQGLSNVPEWGEGGKVMWMMLAVSYFFLGRASEMFAYNDGKIHKDFGLTRGDVSFFCGMVQLSTPELWRCADRVELLFRGSKGDQKRYGEVVSRKKTVVGATDFNWDSMPPSVSHLRGEIGGFEVMLELMLVYPNLELSCPLATYADGDRWRVWTRNQATVSLRELVGRQGLVSEEYALHSGRIGGATRLAAGGVSTLEIQRQGRWKSDAFMMYVRATREEEDKVSCVLASNAVAAGIQPGQGTKWGGGRVRTNY
jgi:hypothetical protein